MTTKNTLRDPKVLAAIEALPPLYATENDTKDRPAVKLFATLGSAFWVIWEYNPDTKVGFGYADLGWGTGELGYVPVGELLDTKDGGLWIERDMAVKTLTEGYASRNVEVPDYVVNEAA